MLARQDLGRVYATFNKSLSRLQRRYELARALSSHVEAGRHAAQVVVELQSVWTAYCRHAFLSLAYNPRRSGGGRASSSLGLTTTNALLDHIILERWRQTRGRNPNARRPTKRNGAWPALSEPRWRKPDQLHDLALLVGATNEREYRLAAQVPGDLLGDIDAFRNFFAHRTRRGSRDAQNLAPTYGVSALRRPWDIVLRGSYNRIPTLHAWADYLRQIGRFYCS